MAKNLNSINIKNFTTGLNVIDSQLQIADSDLPVAENVEFTLTGGVKSINGLTTIGSNITVNGVDGTKFLGGVVFNQLFYLMVSNGTVARLIYWTGSAWAEANSQNFDPDALVEFQVYGDKLFFINGLTTNSNVLHMLTTANVLSGLGTSTGLETGMVAIALHLERLWISKGNKLFVSALYPTGTSTDWDASTVYSGANTAGIIQIDNYTEDSIMAIRVMFGSLVVLRKFSIWLIEGQTVLQMYISKRTNAMTGVNAARSVAKADTSLYFMSNQGIKIFTGQTVKEGVTNVDTISTDRLDRKISSLVDAFTNQSLVVGHAFKDKYYLSDPGASQIFVFDEITGGWSKWTSMKAEIFLDFNGILYCGSVKNFYSVNTNTSSSIHSEIKTKDFNMGTDLYSKVFHSLTAIFRTITLPSTFTITWYLDGNVFSTGNFSTTVTSNSVTWDVSGYSWDGEFDWDVPTINFNKKVKRHLQSGTTLSFLIEATGINRFSLDSLEVTFEQTKRGGY